MPYRSSQRSDLYLAVVPDALDGTPILGQPEPGQIATMGSGAALTVGLHADGETDDAPFIQAALDAAVAVLDAGGGHIARGIPVLLPAGRILIASTLFVPQSVKLIGAGIRNTEIIADPAGDFAALDNPPGSVAAMAQLGRTTELDDLDPPAWDDDRIVTGTTIENCEFDGSGIEGLWGVRTFAANEQAGVNRFRTYDCAGGGIKFMNRWEEEPYRDPDNPENLGSVNNAFVSDYDDLVLTADAGRVSISMTGVPPVNELRVDRHTVNWNGAGSPMDAGIVCHGSLVLTQGHYEGCTIGADVLGDDARIDRCTGHETTDATVRLGIQVESAHLTSIKKPPHDDGWALIDQGHTPNIIVDTIGSYTFSPAGGDVVALA